MATIQSSKNALRKEIKHRILQLSEIDKKCQSKFIIEKLFSLAIFKNSKRISVYLSTENEVNTEPIVRKIFEEKKECFVPRYTKTEMQMVKLHSMEDWDTLPLTPWKIKQPSLKDDRENAMTTGGLDLIILPGVGFTKNRDRLGHGGGYYDRYLLEINKIKPTSTVAICFKEQVLNEIPTHEHDQKVDLVLYGEE